MIHEEISTQNVAMARRSSGVEVPAEARLAMALRYLAGGSFLDIQLVHGVSHPEVFRSVWRVVDAINSALKIDFPIDDMEELDTIETGFAAKSRRQVLRGVVGAVDGCIIWTKDPGIAVHNPRRYYCARKEKFGMLLMAVCNAEREFTYIDLSYAPTSHDSLAWLGSELGQKVLKGCLPEA